MLVPAIPAILAVLIWAVLYFTGYDTHTNDGILFAAAVIATGWLLFRKPASLNNKAK